MNDNLNVQEVWRTLQGVTLCLNCVRLEPRRLQRKMLGTVCNSAWILWHSAMQRKILRGLPDNRSQTCIDSDLPPPQHSFEDVSIWLRSVFSMQMVQPPRACMQHPGPSLVMPVVRSSKVLWYPLVGNTGPTKLNMLSLKQSICWEVIISTLPGLSEYFVCIRYRIVQFTLKNPHHERLKPIQWPQIWWWWAQAS